MTNGPVRILRDQGLNLQIGPGLNGEPALYMTAPDGKLYILSAQDLDDLQKMQKLNLAGIQEHDEIIKRAGNDK
jgi:hypothetical protein